MEAIQIQYKTEILPNINWLGEAEFCRIYGYNSTKIEQRIKDGRWLLGDEYIVDGRSRLFNIKEIEKWLIKQSKAN